MEKIIMICEICLKPITKRHSQIYFRIDIGKKFLGGGIHVRCLQREEQRRVRMVLDTGLKMRAARVKRDRGLERGRK